MKTVKLIALVALAFTFSRCKSATESTTTAASSNSVIQIVHILDTVRGKFYDLAMANLSASPQQILVMTADWAKTQPNVTSATWFDSTYLNIKMKSGLQTVFAIGVVGSDSISLTRGGGDHAGGGRLVPTVKANHKITNKSVLIYSPFVEREQYLYHKGEILPLVNKIRNSGKGVSVTLLEGDDCKAQIIETFGNYGLVIIDTHGEPDGFWTGHSIEAPSLEFDTTDAIIRERMNNAIPDGYNKIIKGYFRFGWHEIVGHSFDWREFLKKRSGSDTYSLFATASYINSLPAMPNTIIVGNMCYSGWNNVGKARYGYEVKDPIKQAFTNRNLISYYSYANSDGTSLPVDNAFGKLMEDSLLTSLIIDGDSTGNAYLNSSDQQFTAGDLLGGKSASPTMPFIHSGADDYSFDDCVTVYTDARDGKIYKAVCIGDQNWMAENLRYEASGSVCYNDDAANCDIYGKMYDWNTAMNGESASTASPSGVRGICPKGWHLPSQAEWNKLYNNLGGASIAGGALRSTSALWDAPNTGATNSSGFSGEPGGLYYFANTGVWKYSAIGQTAFWWTTSMSTSTNPGPTYTKLTNTGTGISNIGLGTSQQEHLNCRCLKD